MTTAVVRLFAHAPLGLVLRVRAGAGPRRDRWMAALRDALDGIVVLRCPAPVSAEALDGGVDVALTLAAGRAVRRDGLIGRATGGVLVVPSAERLGEAASASLGRAVDAGRLGLVLLDEGEADEAPPPALLDRVALVALPDLPEQDASSSLPRPRRPASRKPVVPEPIRVALCETALSLGIVSLRPLLAAERIASSAAALDGRDVVGEADATLAAVLVLAPHRATGQAAEPPPRSAENEADAGQDGAGNAASPEERADGGAGDALERILAAVGTTLPPGLLDGLAPPPRPRRDRKTGRRGAPLPPRRGRPRAGATIAIVATVRAAAPFQDARRRERPLADGASDRRRLLLRADDIHLERRRQRPRRNAVFVVDASGSAAASRLAEAKGAIETLLGECYSRRDRVALLAVRGAGAALVLPPTAALTRARRLLASMPSGGGTPLAAGLDAALDLVVALRRAGEDALVVLMTDGQANVARDGAADRGRARSDAAASGDRLRQARVPSLLVDIARRSTAEAERLAAAMGASYLRLPGGDGARVGRTVRALGP